MADEFVFGQISRVSREAPVLILRQRETQTVPGGGANAANNLVDLGARVRAGFRRRPGCRGRRAAGIFQIQSAAHPDASNKGSCAFRGWTTPAKTRFLAGWEHTTRQQVLRMDREPSGELPAKAAGALVRKAKDALPGATGVLVSDYGYGAASPEILRAIKAQKDWPVRVALDSRYRLHEFNRLGITAATPNEAEMEAAHHAQIGADLKATGTARAENGDAIGFRRAAGHARARRHDALRARARPRSRWPCSAATKLWMSPARATPSSPCFRWPWPQARRCWKPRSSPITPEGSW